MIETIYQFFKAIFDPAGGWLMAKRMVAASSYASDIDSLIALVTIIVGFWFVLAEGALFYLIFKYRKREGKPTTYVTGHEKEYLRWIKIPHDIIIVCDVLILFMAITVWYKIKQDLPPAERTVRIMAQQWSWVFQDPGADGQLDTPDDIVTSNDLHVEVNKLYHYQLQARDVVHDFSVPVFRLKQDAIPGRTITGWFKPIRTGTHDIQCAEICGIGHGLMVGRIYIETPEQHADWIKTNSKPGAVQVAALN